MINKIIIFKNDAVGDLVQSLDAINNIINHNQKNKILIYLSNRSKNFDFLVKFENVEVKILNYDLSVIEKIKILYKLLFGSYSSIYILTPKNFYFYLPIFFKKIKFYALCINGKNNYKRPTDFLRKHLFKYVINERNKTSKRKSTMEIQVNLTSDLNYNESYRLRKLPETYISNLNKIKNYIYFHLKSDYFKRLGWGTDELDLIFKNFLKYRKKIIFTRDIENENQINDYSKTYNIINFKNGKEIDNNSPILLCENATGSDLYNIIKKADKIIAFHGMMTNLGSIEKKEVLDLFYCDIKNINDYQRYRNALYEFKPKYKKYNFIIPSKNIFKTINKMNFFLKK